MSSRAWARDLTNAGNVTLVGEVPRFARDDNVFILGAHGYAKQILSRREKRKSVRPLQLEHEGKWSTDRNKFGGPRPWLQAFVIPSPAAAGRGNPHRSWITQACLCDPRRYAGSRHRGIRMTAGLVAVSRRRRCACHSERSRGISHCS